MQDNKKLEEKKKDTQLRRLKIDEPPDEDGREDDHGRHEVSIVGVVCRNDGIIFRVVMSDGSIKQKKSKQIKSPSVMQSFRKKCSSLQKRAKISIKSLKTE